MSTTFIHTADWQIGKPFGTMGEASTFLKTQRISTIKKIAGIAHSRNVDAVLVAGDVFDDNAVSDKTIHQVINAMAGFKGQWVLLPGNHDAAVAECVWTRMRPLCPENVQLADTPQPIMIAGSSAVVMPAPLQRRHDTNDLTSWFDSYESGPGIVRIGLAHGSVSNRLPERSESMNPISDRRSETAHLDYLGLGDWHGTLDIAPRTWYSGTHETDRFKSNDSGNILLVSIPDAGVPPIVEKIETGHFKWHQLEVSLLGGSGVNAVHASLEKLGAEEDRAVVQLHLTGIIDLEQRAKLNEVLTAWAARLHYLTCDEKELRAEPSKDDLSQIGTTGFIGLTVEKLTSIAEDAADSRCVSARLALQILFLEQMKLASSKL